MRRETHRQTHKHTDVCDFRAIAISPILSKVFEYCFLDRFSSYLETSHNQFGFKKGVGCSHAIYSVRNIADGLIHAKSTVNVCALDLSKAFDKVNHHALFIKLMKRNIPIHLLKILENMFVGCLRWVKWNNVLSYIFQLNFGVKQKSVLSPALFAVYLDNLSNLFILERHKLIILYADDILIIAPSITGLERMLHACEQVFHWLDMAVNFKKSCGMRIGPRCDINCAKIVSLARLQILDIWVYTLSDRGFLNVH